MDSQILISKNLSDQVLMLGVYYKHHAPGGMAAVIQYYERYFAVLHYICTWKDGSKLIKLYYFITAYFNCILRFCFNPKIKIVHIHTAADASFWRKSIFIRLAKSFHKKVIVHVHASRFKDFYNENNRKNTIIKNLQRADILIVLSQSWKEWFTNIGISQTKIVVLNNIVDYPQIDDRKKDIDGKVNLLFLGEIGQRKGVFDILQALSIYKSFLKNKVEFRIGGNKKEEELLLYIQNNGLQNFVHFEGWVSGDEKVRLLNWADIFILPSFNEGLPISILEAMNYGCAIISTPVGGILEIVHDGENGIIVQPGNIMMIGDAVKKLVYSPIVVRQMGDKSRIMVRRFLPDAVFQKLNNIYESLLK